MTQPPTPAVVKRSDPARIDVEWTDGARSEFTAAELRAVCPCAQCVDEITGERRHDPASVPADLTQSNLHLVGHYALAMTFSDGHHTGIYTFQMLRGLRTTPPKKGARTEHG